jgi:hypothetical protein
MAEHRLEMVHQAIQAGIFGNIEWKGPARKRMERDPEMDGITTEEVRLLLRDFVRNGGVLEVRHEKRIEYQVEHPYWYKALVAIPDFARPLFVELILSFDDPVDPFVEIVSVHF